MTAPAAPPAVSLRALFWGFTRVGLSGFGGVLPFARRMIVEGERWLTPEEFNTLLGLCQFLPGPNVINLAVVIGRRFQGAAGAILAPLGLLAAPMVIVLILGWLYDLYGSLPVAQAMLRGICCVGAGLLFAMSLRMAQALKEPRVYLPFALAVFVAVALLRWPLPWVMVSLACCSSYLAFRRLKRAP